MSIKFKKYVEYVSQEEELTEAQLDEIFGLFKNNQKIEKIKADREKLKQDTAKKVADWRAKKAQAMMQQGNDEDNEVAKNKQLKSTPKAAASGRAAERDWVNNLTTE